MKRWALIAAGSVLALLVAFLGGRFSAPVKTVERTKVEAKVETKAAAEEKRNEGTASVTERVIVKRVRAAAPTPPGCPPCAPIQEEETHETVHASAFDLGTTHFDFGQKVEQRAESVKVTETARTGWRLQLDAGWSSLLPKPNLYGVDFSRRLVGTLWVGAWARTDRTAGLSLALEW